MSWFDVNRSTFIQYDTVEEFNVDSKAECDQLNLAHVARKNIKKKKLKQTNVGAHLSSVQVKIREGSPERIRVREKRICESDEF